MAIEIKHLDNFYSRLLGSNYYSLYLECVSRLRNGTFNISYTMDVDDSFSEQVKNVVSAILYGCPELFYVGQNVSFEYNGGQVHVSFPNNYPNKKLNDLNDELNEKIGEISGKIAQIPDFFDKIFALNEYLCDNIIGENDYTDDNGNAYGTLINNRARCEGVCKAAKLILDRLDINSIICVGSAFNCGNEYPHAWMLIEYEGQNYAFDFSFNISMTVHHIPGVVYTFMDRKNIEAEHKGLYFYPVTEDDQYLFWKRHNGETEYLYELANADILEHNNCFYSVHHFVDMEFDDYQENNEMGDWVMSELSPYSRADSFTFVYRRPINVLMVYFINE